MNQNGRQESNRKISAFFAALLLFLQILCCLFSGFHLQEYHEGSSGFSSRNCAAQICHSHARTSYALSGISKEKRVLSEDNLFVPAVDISPVLLRLALQMSPEIFPIALQTENIPDRSVLFLWNRTIRC